MNTKKLLGSVPTDLLYQALETEKGGVQVYTAALRCALNKDLRDEWNKYLEQTKTHVQICTDLIRELGLEPETETPGRQVVRYLGTSLVKTIELAQRNADPQAAQIVAQNGRVRAAPNHLISNATARSGPRVSPARDEAPRDRTAPRRQSVTRAAARRP